MSHHRSTFLAGIISGFVIGLSTGHLTLWRGKELSRPGLNSQDHVQIVPKELSYELGSPSEYLPFYSGEYETGVATIPATSPDGIDDDLSIESPLANAISIRTVELEDREVTQQPVFEFDQSEVQEPQPLAVPEALPIAPQVPTLPGNKIATNQSQLRTIIEQELPDLPAAQREIWLESLSEMSVEDATGVLRMWKAIGGQEPGLINLPTDPSITTPDPDKLPSAENSNPSSVGEIIQQAIAVHRQNLLMSSTLGYLRIVPRFTEEIQNQRPVVTGITEEFDFSPGQTLVTGNPLDLRIDGPGLFLVHDADGASLLTRRGRFSVNDEYQLALIDGAEEYVLQPVIQLPDDFERIIINWDGRISITENDNTMPREIGTIRICPIFQAHQLRYHKNGLIRLADGATPPIPTLPDGNGCGRLQQGIIEVSNVLPARELEQITRFQSESKLWQ